MLHASATLGASRAEGERSKDDDSCAAASLPMDMDNDMAGVGLMEVPGMASAGVGEEPVR